MYFIYLLFHLFIHLFIILFIYHFIYLFIYLFIYSFILFFKGVLHPRSVFGLFLHFSQKLQHIGNK